MSLYRRIIALPSPSSSAGFFFRLDSSGAKSWIPSPFGWVASIRHQWRRLRRSVEPGPQSSHEDRNKEVIVDRTLGILKLLCDRLQFVYVIGVGALVELAEFASDKAELIRHIAVRYRLNTQ